jgi:hypothetical protein
VVASATGFSESCGVSVGGTGTDIKILLLVFRETHNRLLGIVEGIPATDLWKDRGLRARRKEVTIGRLLEAELQDEEEHYFQLKQYVESDVKS